MSVSETIDRGSPRLAADNWRTSLIALGAAAAALLVLFRSDFLFMASVWVNSPTFNHCLLILPIIGWLIWHRRAELALLSPRTSYWGFLVVGLGAASWLVGEAAGVTLARHFGIIVMLQGCVVGILGLTVSRGILFPLAYALFLVPFGEEFIPSLQMITADLCMFLLGLVGLPAHIEGVFITTPSGYFEVAEACSGVKFLIAMVALGALAANLCFKSWTRRIAFMGICVVVPIVANGIRAFGTIYIADRTGIGFAESFDHVVYGWFFFAFVIGAIFAMSWKFFDRDLDEPAFDPSLLSRHDTGQEFRPTVSTIYAAALLVLATTPIMWLSISATARADVAVQLQRPDIPGWTIDETPMAYQWRANYDGADQIVTGRYRNSDGQIVDLAVSYFSDPSEGREPVGIGQGGLPIETEWSWIEDSALPEHGQAYRIMAPGPVSREVFQYVTVGGSFAASDVSAKLATLQARLFGGDRSAKGIVISAEGDDARAAIENFLLDSGGVDQLVDRVTGMAD